MNTTIDNGSIKISSEVISCIVKIAVDELKGVYIASETLLDKVFQMKEKAVTMTFKDNDSIDIDANIQLEFGVNIPSKVKELQEVIIENVEIMTGLNVDSVNIKVVSLVQESAIENSK